MLTDCAKNQKLCPPELVQQTLELNLAQTEGAWVDLTVDVGFDPISSNAQKKKSAKDVWEHYSSYGGFNKGDWMRMV